MEMNMKLEQQLGVHLTIVSTTKSNINLMLVKGLNQTLNVKYGVSLQIRL